MNQLIFPSKSIGLKTEDLKHLYDQVVQQMQAFGQCLSQFQTGNIYRLAGVQWTVNGQSYSVTAGFLFYANELFAVEAWSGTATGAQIPVWELDEQNGAHEPHNLYEGNLNVGTYNFTKVRKLRPRLGASGTGVANFNEVKPSPLEKINGLFGIQTGMIIDYSGSLANFDGTGLGINNFAGYALCNGNNGTPDLQGKFIVGYAPSDADYNGIGKTGGAKQVALALEEMPEHTHRTFNADIASGGATNLDPANPDLPKHASYNHQESNDNDYIISGTNSAPTLGETSVSGAGEPHENRPPYYVLAKIMKL